MNAENKLAEENRRLRQENEALRLQRDTLQVQSQVLESQTEALRSEADALRAQTEDLQTQTKALQTQAGTLQAQLQELEIIRRNLEHTVAVYKRCLFGSRSEKIDPKELEARIAQAAAEAREQLAKEKRPGDPPPEAEEEQPEEKANTAADPADPPADKPGDPQKEKKRKARPHGRGGFPAHLPRRRIVHPVDPAKAVCACCSDHPALIQVGEDTCEKLVKLPVQYEVHVHVYPQMACQRCHEGVTSAPRQDTSLKADVSVIADVVVKKYVLPKSPLDRALSYAENQWPAMARYLEVAQAELDNNSTEHSLRNVVPGRRNWLHVGQEAGGEKAANLFSLMITCKRLGVEPYAYLHDILRRLPTHPTTRTSGSLRPGAGRKPSPPRSDCPVPAPESYRLSTQPLRSTRETSRRAAGATRPRRTVTF